MVIIYESCKLEVVSSFFAKFSIRGDLIQFKNVKGTIRVRHLDRVGTILLTKLFQKYY